MPLGKLERLFTQLISKLGELAGAEAIAGGAAAEAAVGQGLLGTSAANSVAPLTDLRLAR